jgi:LPXTG-motif cell wall-anchored protein
VNAVRVPWSSASFLVYLGGLTILFATATLLNFEAESHGSAGLVFWAFLIFVAISAAALAARALGHFVTAGLLATSAVVALVVFLGSILEWFGWLPDTEEGGVFEGFRFWLLVLELFAIAASAVALRLFEFPLLVLLLAASSWFFVTDLISGGGNWSAIVTIAVGLVFLLAAIAVDDGPSRPFGFWLHVAAGLTIGGGLLWFFHDGLFDWIVVGVVGTLYVLLGDRLSRSSWVVLGGWGLLQTATYFADRWSDISQLFFPFFFLFPFFISFDESGGEAAHDWLGPLVYALLGLVFISIGLWLVRRRREAIPGAEFM